MSKLSNVRGTKDLLPEQFVKHQYIKNKVAEIAVRYGFQQMTTPILEFTELFQKSIGEDTDIVSKEMYSFLDKGGESLTMRPEFTASIARSFISNGLKQNLPCKFFSTGPLFRYERPQKGRLRQFHQINFETIGIRSAFFDCEIINLAHDVIQSLQITDKVNLEINSLGNEHVFHKYRKVLIEYFNDYKQHLSADNIRRLESNPLRILDSKDVADQQIISKAPKINQYYDHESQEYFATILEGLESLSINYIVNDKLVRGLDYYNDVIFEFTTKDIGETQNTVIAGGRYDKLISDLSKGKEAQPAIGFAGGIERIVELITVNSKKMFKIAIIDLDESYYSLRVLNLLHAHSYHAEQIFGGNLTKRMKKANKMEAIIVIIIGSKEFQNRQVKIKDMSTGQEVVISIDDLVSYLDVNYQS